MSNCTRTSLSVLAMASLLASCASAAQLGDDAIRVSSFGRVQATPFTDVIKQEECRETLLRAVGFTHQSLAITEGVQIKQAYHCEAERIVARVNLKNLTGAPMQCVARTEDAEFAARVGPYGLASFEYSFVHGANHTCFELG